MKRALIKIGHHSGYGIGIDRADDHLPANGLAHIGKTQCMGTSLTDQQFPGTVAWQQISPRDQLHPIKRDVIFVAEMKGYIDRFSSLFFSRHLRIPYASGPSAPPLSDHLLYASQLPDLIRQYRYLTRLFGSQLPDPILIRLESSYPVCCHADG
jgi:hypothetical protein